MLNTAHHNPRINPPLPSLTHPHLHPLTHSPSFPHPSSLTQPLSLSLTFHIFLTASPLVPYSHLLSLLHSMPTFPNSSSPRPLPCLPDLVTFTELSSIFPYQAPSPRLHHCQGNISLALGCRVQVLMSHRGSNCTLGNTISALGPARV